jgi:raffinose/stachyose/melibiose transport system substrate-binding protein
LYYQFEEYIENWATLTGFHVEVEVCDSMSYNCNYETRVMNGLMGEQPLDIFIYEDWNEISNTYPSLLDFSGQPWTAYTDFEKIEEEKVVGYPIAIEGWGLIYNEDILEAAFSHEGIGRTIDSLKVVSQAEYQEVFEAIEAYYEANNMTNHTVVSMAAGLGMTWVTGLHNFNGYLSSGLNRSDRTIIDDFNNGIVDINRLEQYVDWVELLFSYSDPDILLNGYYDTQVDKFVDGEAAFLHQGNWVASEIELHSDFTVGFLPHASLAEGNDSIFVDVVGYFIANQNTNVPTIVNQFLNDLALTDEGKQYYADETNLVSAFTNNPYNYGVLNRDIKEYYLLDKTYAWWMLEMPVGFGMDVLGNLYYLYAMTIVGENGGFTKQEFLQAIINEIESLNEG